MGNGEEENKEAAQKAVAGILNTPAKKDFDSSDKAELKKALDDASSQTRNLLIAFLVLLFYIFVNAAGTTHRMLLIPNSTLKIPFLDIGLPIVEFYIAAPLLILVFHFDLLFNLHKHAEKLRAWKTADGNELALYPFIFNFVHTRGEAGPITWLLKVLATFLATLFPLFVLIYVESKFLAYHHSLITPWHVVAILIDLVLLRTFWLRIVGEQSTPIDKLSLVKATKSFLKEAFSKETYKSLDLFTRVSPFLFAISVFLFLIPNEFGILLSPKIFILDLHEQTLLGKEPGDAVIAEYLLEGKTSEDAFLEQGTGLDLKGRNLEFANFIQSKLTKADLRDTHLESAYLMRAHLEGGIMRDAHLEGADFRQAHLEGADLSYAHLEGANLFDAHLEGADLSYAHLEGADLSFAHLEGADLSYAHLEGANLRRTRLEGTGLRRTHLEGADLSYAHLEGADLRQAHLEGANLTDSGMAGAVLGVAETLGTIFPGEDKMRGVYFNDPVSFFKPDWEIIKKLRKNIPQERQSKFDERISDAEKRCASKTAFETPDIMPDVEKFLKSRIDTACKNKGTAQHYYSLFNTNGPVFDDFRKFGIEPPQESSPYYNYYSGYSRVYEKIEKDCPQFITGLKRPEAPPVPK